MLLKNSFFVVKNNLMLNDNLGGIKPDLFIMIRPVFMIFLIKKNHIFLLINLINFYLE